MTVDRRTFLTTAGFSGAAIIRELANPLHSWAQADSQPATRFIQTSVLAIGYEDRGSQQAFPVILLHGFPDDVRAWDEVAPPLVSAGYRVLVPYLRGYGPTRFLDVSAPRMAEQAAIGQDLVDFADALRLQRFAVAGYDWGGRAACIAAALQPDRVRAAVLIGGYSIQNTIAPPRPAAPAAGGTSTPSAAGRGWPPIAAASADSSGKRGRRRGISAPRPMSGRRRRSRTRISWTW